VTARRFFVLAGVAVFWFAVGIVPSLFTAGPALFADGPYGERFLALLIGVAAMLFFGFVGGFVAPTMWRLVAFSLAAPVLVTVVWFDFVGGVAPRPYIMLGLTFVGAFIGATLLGASVGRGLRLRLRERGQPSAEQ